MYFNKYFIEQNLAPELLLRINGIAFLYVDDNHKMIILIYCNSFCDKYLYILVCSSLNQSKR